MIKTFDRFIFLQKNNYKTVVFLVITIFKKGCRICVGLCHCFVLLFFFKFQALTKEKSKKMFVLVIQFNSLPLKRMANILQSFLLYSYIDAVALFVLPNKQRGWKSRFEIFSTNIAFYSSNITSQLIFSFIMFIAPSPNKIVPTPKSYKYDGKHESAKTKLIICDWFACCLLP